MTTPTPDAPPPPPPPPPRPKKIGYNPFSRRSFSDVPAARLLAALLIIIPGICFILPVNLGPIYGLLALVWVVALVMSVVLLVSTLFKMIARAFRK